MDGNKTYKQLYLNKYYKIRKNKLLQTNQKKLNDLDINVKHISCQAKVYWNTKTEENQLGKNRSERTEWFCKCKKTYLFTKNSFVMA